jgi:hypothetical protein
MGSGMVDTAKPIYICISSKEIDVYSKNAIGAVRVALKGGFNGRF